MVLNGNRFWSWGFSPQGNKVQSTLLFKRQVHTFFRGTSTKQTKMNRWESEPGTRFFSFRVTVTLSTPSIFLMGSLEQHFYCSPRRNGASGTRIPKPLPFGFNSDNLDEVKMSSQGTFASLKRIWIWILHINVFRAYKDAPFFSKTSP